MLKLLLSLYLRWVHFEEVLVDDELVSTTNLSEGLNSRLNEGFKFCENVAQQISLVKQFKVGQVERYMELISNRCWVPGRRSKTRERHEQLKSMVNEFLNLGINHQEEKLIEFSMAIGRLMAKTRK